MFGIGLGITLDVAAIRPHVLIAHNLNWHSKAFQITLWQYNLLHIGLLLCCTYCFSPKVLQLGAMSIEDKWYAKSSGSMDKESGFKVLDAFFEHGFNVIGPSFLTKIFHPISKLCLIAFQPR